MRTRDEVSGGRGRRAIRSMTRTRKRTITILFVFVYVCSAAFRLHMKSGNSLLCYLTFPMTYELLKRFERFK